jgi:hypothetical protein
MPLDKEETIAEVDENDKAIGRIKRHLSGIGHAGNKLHRET